LSFKPTVQHGLLYENALQRTQRILLACVGGYCLSATLATWSAWLLSAALPRSEAVVLMAMVSYVIYLLILLWAFAEDCLLRLWLVFAGIPLAGWIGRLVLGLGSSGAAA